MIIFIVIIIIVIIIIDITILIEWVVIRPHCYHINTHSIYNTCNTYVWIIVKRTISLLYILLAVFEYFGIFECIICLIIMRCKFIKVVHNVFKMYSFNSHFLKFSCILIYSVLSVNCQCKYLYYLSLTVEYNWVELTLDFNSDSYAGNVVCLKMGWFNQHDE